MKTITIIAATVALMTAVGTATAAPATHTTQATTYHVAYKSGDIMIAIGGPNRALVNEMGRIFNSGFHGQKYAGRYGTLRAGWGTTINGQPYAVGLFTRKSATARLAILLIAPTMRQNDWQRIK